MPTNSAFAKLLMNIVSSSARTQPIPSALAAEVKALVDATAYTDALAPAREYVRQKPDDSSGHVLLGMVYRGLGDYREGRAGTGAWSRKGSGRF